MDFTLVLQDIEHGASPDGSNPATTVPKKCEKAILARIWGNFDKKFVDSLPSIQSIYYLHIITIW